MATCSTNRWVSTAPYVKLTVEQSASTATTSTLKYTLQYISDTPANAGSRAYTIKINGSTAASGSYNIDGKTGTNLIKEGTVVITKGTSAKSIAFSIAFDFKITWSGSYAGTLSASGSISVAAKTSYKVSYNANGGSGAPSAQTKWHDTALTLSTTKPTRSGYTFSKWNTNSAGTGTSYSSGGSYTANANATLYAIWTTNYTQPKITSMSVVRCNSAGTADANGTYCRVKFNWTSSKSVTSIQIKFTTTSLQTVTVSVSGTTSGSVNQVVGNGALSTANIYAITAYVGDGTKTVNATRTLPGAVIPLSIKKNAAIGFGRRATTDGHAEFGFHAKFDNNTAIKGTTTTGVVKTVFEPQNAYGNTIVGYDNYTSKSGNTHIYGHDLRFYVSNCASNADYKPYYSKGDTLSMTIRTSGYVTNASKEVQFVIPLTKPVIGTPTVTVASGNGFILRQGTKYTHGSASGVGVSATYAPALDSDLGIVIVATFAATTNAVNNDAIGVQWNGTITFS